MFREPYADIAAFGKREGACRQIASRARRKVRAARPPEVAPAGPEITGCSSSAATCVQDGSSPSRALRNPNKLTHLEEPTTLW